MKKTIITLLLLISVLPLRAEYIFLKDGSIIKGKVINETADVVTLQNEQKVVVSYPHYNIMRVLYSELNMGKMFVQLKSGESFRGYLIEEEEATFRFRYIINKPEEFVVEKEEVLFLAERNPSGLKGKSGNTDIELKWYPPYDSMRFYNIYIKKNKEDKYRIAGTSITNSYDLINLSSNTFYYIKVTGVDDTGIETTPSNEILISTLNNPPFSPSGLKVTKLNDGALLLEWKAANDPDGTIIKYRIYKTYKSRMELAGETKTTSYKFTSIDYIDRVLVSSVDEKGAESDTTSAGINQTDIFSIYLTPSVLLPVDIFGTMGDAGFGGTISFMAQNLCVKGFNLGLEFGYYYIPGKKNTFRAVGENINWINLVTGTIKTSYSFKLNKFLYISPALSIGAAYLDLTYTARDYQTLADTEKAAKGFDPMAALSITLDFMISGNFFIGINAGYGLLFETRSQYQFFSFGVNLGVRF